MKTRIIQYSVGAVLCLFLIAGIGLNATAQKRKKAAGPSLEELMAKANQAMLSYDFDEAMSLFSQAKKKAPAADRDLHEDIETGLQRASMGSNFLDRVEKITILDSIAVPKSRFFKSYLIPPSSGSLNAIDANGVADADYAFLNENGDYKIWAAPDSLGILRLLEANRLTDGSWSFADTIPDLGDGDAAYPFMMPDGVTLYYADNGPESLGGYDIMVATRDASDGSFLQPQNLGMPYNSPFDDYLLAIDELNGVGWWATDRNRLGDFLTIYLYKVNDLRTNHDPDRDDIADLARIHDWKSTQEPDEDYSELLASVKAINPNIKAKKNEFILPMDGGKTYTSYSDFRNRNAASMMRSYLAEEAKFRKNEKQLEQLRREYRDTPSPQLRATISQFEADVEKQRASLRAKLSDVYKAERFQK